MEVQLFSLCYLAAFIGYSSIGSVTYALYAQYKISNIMLVTGISTFIGFGTANAIVVHIVKKMNLKISLLIGFIGFAIYQFTILVTILFSQEQTPFFSALPFLYTINAGAGIVAGFSNALVWTVNPSYIQIINPQDSMTSKMGTFWSIYMWGTILGGLINIFVLGYVSKFVYLVVVLGFSGLGVTLTWLFTKPYKLQIQNTKKVQVSALTSIKKEFINLWSIVKSKCPNVFFYSLLSGLFLSYYVVFINNIIFLSLPQQTDEQTLDRDTGIVFMCQGISAIFTGLAQRNKRIGQANKLKSLKIGLAMLELNILKIVLAFNLLDHQQGMFWVSIVIIMLCEITQIHIKTALDAYIRQYHEGKVQFYSLNIFFYSIGSIIAFLLLLIGDGNVSLVLMINIGVIIAIFWLARDSQIVVKNEFAQTREQEELQGKLIVNEELDKQ